MRTIAWILFSFAEYIKHTLLNFYSERDNLNWWNDTRNDINRTEARRGNGRKKLRTYKLFKLEHKTENYVTTSLSRRHRSAFAKFRAGVAPLRLETGLCEQLELNHRVCFHCKMEVESEEHVLTLCPLYNDLRRTLYEKLSYFIPNFEVKSNSDKVACILDCELTPVIRMSVKICSDILIRR